MKSTAPGLAALFLTMAALAVSLPALRLEHEQQEKAEIRHEVTVTLKLVQVFVVDKKGNPIVDLTKDDFRVFDNGKEHVITEFEKHTLRRPAQGTEERGMSLEEPPPLPSRNLMPRKFFLFFDFAYNTPKGLRKAKEAALHFIDSRLRPTDEVGVLSYSGLEGLDLWESLTADHQKVREVVDAFGLKRLSGRVENLQEKYYAAVTGQNPADAGAWGRATLRGPEKRLPDMGARPDFDSSLELRSWKFAEKGELHAVAFADRITDLAKALRYIPGQKNIVLFSSGVPYSLIYGIQAPYGDVRFGSFGNSLLKQRYEDMLSELTAANCIIYALDTEDAGASLKKETRTMGVFTLQKLTNDTGGQYFGNINRYAEHIERIQNLTGCYYVLGYPVDEKWDGAFHPIRVEVSRPDCEVHAQKGYYNPKLFKEYNELERMLHLVDLALNEDPVYQTPIRFTVKRRPCPADGTVNLCISAELPLEKISEVIQGRVEIVSLVFDEDGNTIDLKRQERTSAELSKMRAPHDAEFKLAPGTYECRVIIRNLETGRGAVGGLTVTIENERPSG
ncbi:MAG: VWA domain-containing protein [Candidatus Aminicenantes bacterium]|nr:VWA domain-containing protein [Candidatus Aminicenantes bacterium]